MLKFVVCKRYFGVCGKAAIYGYGRNVTKTAHAILGLARQMLFNRREANIKGQQGGLVAVSVGPSADVQ